METTLSPWKPFYLIDSILRREKYYIGLLYIDFLFVLTGLAHAPRQLPRAAHPSLREEVGRGELQHGQGVLQTVVLDQGNEAVAGMYLPVGP